MSVRKWMPPAARHGADRAGASGELRVSCARGRPPSMVFLWSGGGGHTDETGRAQLSLVAMQTTRPPSSWTRACGWIGVQAKAKDGSLDFPIGVGGYGAARDV